MEAELARLERIDVATAASPALSIGPWSWQLRGLDPAIRTGLERRWGRFFSEREGVAVDVVDDDGLPWVEQQEAGEIYRVDARQVAGRSLLLSYGFAVWSAGDRYRVVLRPESAEPVERRIENALRWIVARRVAAAGGLALHGAGWEYDDRAYLLVGASNAGKTTALSFAPAGRSLGDDFALAVPGPDGWWSAATPFDNAERADAIAPTGPLPLVGLWRLIQDPDPRIERPIALLAQASLLSCAAFSASMAEQSEAIATAAGRLVADGLFAHLHFARDARCWALLGVD